MQKKKILVLAGMCVIFFIMDQSSALTSKTPFILQSCTVPERIYPDNLSTRHSITDIATNNNMIAWTEIKENKRSELWSFSKKQEPRQQTTSDEGEVNAFALSNNILAWSITTREQQEVRWCTHPCNKSLIAETYPYQQQLGDSFGMTTLGKKLAWFTQPLQTNRSKIIKFCDLENNGHKEGCLLYDRKGVLELRAQETIRKILTTNNNMYILTKEWPDVYHNQTDRLYLFSYATKNLKKIYEEEAWFTNSHIKTFDVATLQTKNSTIDILFMLYNPYTGNNTWKILALPIYDETKMSDAVLIREETEEQKLRDFVVHREPAQDMYFAILSFSPQTQRAALEIKTPQGWKELQLLENIFFVAKSMYGGAVVYTEATEPVNKIWQIRCDG